MNREKFESEDMDDAVFGQEITIDPEEADQMGAFEEDALSQDDAEESRFDDES